MRQDNNMQMLKVSRMHKFCQRWLEFVAIMHIAGGVALTLHFPEAVWTYYQGELFSVFSVNTSAINEVKSMVDMLVRIFGPTVASWGIMMLYLIKRISIHQDKGATFILTIAVLVWFTLDTSLSLLNGMTLHLVLNSSALVAILFPVYWLNAKVQNE
ncbi:hypothetical protein [Aliikangiella coralliicola]|uniref:DUF2127 domain-containing protein n=1 Tax=Aliikangiella coralliicola TaxID=2592383 RepID=A0A545UET4_9GAMM|nr:hypothetical protein [Aliikangiella coralliicola]TQV87992.1 hypothetical protein FLL46_09260 [Aliikangiella coralliicola]